MIKVKEVFLDLSTDFLIRIWNDDNEGPGMPFYERSFRENPEHAYKYGYMWHSDTVSQITYSRQCIDLNHKRFIEDKCVGFGFSYELRYFILYNDQTNIPISDSIFILSQRYGGYKVSPEDIENLINNKGYVNLKEVKFFNTDKRYFDIWSKDRKDYLNHEKNHFGPGKHRDYNPQNIKIDKSAKIYGVVYNVVICNNGKILFTEYENTVNPNNDDITHIKVIDTNAGKIVIYLNGNYVYKVITFNDKLIWKDKLFYHNNYNKDGKKIHVYSPGYNLKLDYYDNDFIEINAYLGCRVLIFLDDNTISCKEFGFERLYPKDIYFRTDEELKESEKLHGLSENVIKSENIKMGNPSELINIRYKELN